MTRSSAFGLFVDRGAKEAGLSIAAHVVWVAIFRHAADRRVSVSVEAVASSTGLGRRAVARALAELKNKGMLRSKAGGAWPNRYLLSPLPTLETAR
jgi:hypothetical protein